MSHMKGCEVMLCEVMSLFPLEKTKKKTTKKHCASPPLIKQNRYHMIQIIR